MTLLGNNTRGEGFSGKPINYYLPESKFAIVFTPSVSERYPDNSIVGTVPDIYCPSTWEDVINRNEMMKDPAIAAGIASYEYRQLWDKPLAEALKLIDSRAQ